MLFFSRILHSITAIGNDLHIGAQTVGAKKLTGKGEGVQPPQCLHSSMRLRNEMELQYPDNMKDSSGK